MALTPLPSFHDLVPLVESFGLFQKSLETHTLSSTAFTATMNIGHFRGGHFRSTGNRHHRGGSHGNTNGPSSSNFDGHSGNNRSRRSYNPHCQICKTEGHTTNRCQDRYDRAEPSAHIAETFPGCTSDWYLDIGASAHMTPDSTALTTSEQYFGKDKVIVGNGAPLPITHTGTSQPSPNLKLLDVLLVPHLTQKISCPLVK